MPQDLFIQLLANPVPNIQIGTRADLWQLIRSDNDSQAATSNAKLLSEMRGVGPRFKMICWHSELAIEMRGEMKRQTSCLHLQLEIVTAQSGVSSWLLDWDTHIGQ